MKDGKYLTERGCCTKPGPKQQYSMRHPDRAGRGGGAGFMRWT